MVKLSLTGVSDGLHLVDVMVVDDVIEGGVELVEEIHHLVGSAAAGQLRETHNVTAQTHKYTIKGGTFLNKAFRDKGTTI